MALHFVDHRGFQRGAVLTMAAAAGVAGLAWAWPLDRAAWWMAAGVGTTLALMRGRGGAILGGAASRATADGLSPAGAGSARRTMVGTAVVVAAVVTLLGAALAGASWWMLTTPAEGVTVGEAAIVGPLAGLAATLALALAHVRAVPSEPIVRALASARATLTGDERALAERAAVAHGRIVRGLAGADSPDGARLRRLGTEVTLQVLGLAERCRASTGELAAIDRDAVRLRAARLSAAAEAPGADEQTRTDFSRAARAAGALDQRVGELIGATERVRARLELQVALLEGTALGVSARQASLAADQAEALGPLADRLHEAGRELHAQADALVEVRRV